MIDNSFSIKPYHWWLTICIATVLHIFLLLTYKQDKPHAHVQADDVHNEIIIGLKKLKSAPNIVKPDVIEIAKVVPVPTKPLEPVKQKPVIKKQIIIEPTPKLKKPIIKPKPKVTPDVITPPQVDDIRVNQHQQRSTKKPSQLNPTSVDVESTSTHIEKQAAQYDAKLAAWLEKHKKYPTIARRRNQQGSVTIEFVINRQGELLRHQLIKPSAYASLNNATIKMIKHASPMPIPPSELIGDKTELKYTIPVNFNLVSK